MQPESAEQHMIQLPCDEHPTPVTNWNVYIILCSDRSLYTGISTDPARRFRQHAGGQGARYFRARKPLRIVYLEPGHTHGSACRRELQIKGMTKPAKQDLIVSEVNRIGNGQVLTCEQT